MKKHFALGKGKYYFNIKSGQSKIITPISSARNSGFPILARSKERLFISWTHVETDFQEIRTAEIFL